MKNRRKLFTFLLVLMVIAFCGMVAILGANLNSARAGGSEFNYAHITVGNGMVHGRIVDANYSEWGKPAGTTTVTILRSDNQTETYYSSNVNIVLAKVPD